MGLVLSPFKTPLLRMLQQKNDPFTCCGKLGCSACGPRDVHGNTDPKATKIAEMIEAQSETQKNVSPPPYAKQKKVAPPRNMGERQYHAFC
jgi:hypothetical protein